MKTPEQIARENLTVDCYDGTDEPIIETLDDLVNLMVRAIEADRAQRD